MRNNLILLSTALFFLCLGLVVGAWQSDQLRLTRAGQWISSNGAKVISLGKNDDSEFESYAYPTIKWRTKALSDGPDAVMRLWTTYEAQKGEQSGVMKYKLTLFKATNRSSREVQLLDPMGFKLFQFNANDFHDIPGAPDIVEARDSVPCPEEQYKRSRDYSVK